MHKKGQRTLEYIFKAGLKQNIAGLLHTVLSIVEIVFKKICAFVYTHIC